MLSAFLNLRQGLFIGDFQVIIGVKAPQGGHGQNLPGFDVHYHAKSTVLHIKLLNGLLHPVLKTSLHRGIQGQHHISPRDRSHIILIRKGHIHFVIALSGNHRASTAVQIAVITGFNSFRAAARGVGKANDLGRQATVRIQTLGARLQMDAGNTVFVDIFPNTIGSIGTDRCFQLFIAHGGICRLLGDPLRFQFQNFSQHPGKLRHIRFGLFQFVGIQIHRLHPNVAGQHIHVTVIDNATLRCHLGSASLIAQRQIGIIVIIGYHEPMQTHHRRHKG